MNKTIGIVAHVDAGKTTLIEQILYNTNTIRQAGRVDKKNTVLDYHSIERQRGITVFSDQASIIYKDSVIHIIDTPGHVDFSAEMERSIRILDCAVIILSAAEGIQGHTETVWKLLREYNIPTVFFINKLDREGADFCRVYDDIYMNFSKNICAFAKPDDTDNFSSVIPLFDDVSIDNSIVEFLSDRNDIFLEKYLNDETVPYEQLSCEVKHKLSDCSMFPCLCGSGLKNIGIDSLLNFFNLFINTNYDSSKEFNATVYKIQHDENNNKLAFIKVNTGSVKVKDIISHKIDDETIDEKINQIRIYKGSQFVPVSSLSAGEFGALIGIDHAYVGEGLGTCDDFNNFSLKPVLQSMVIYDSNVNSHKDVLTVFQLLNAEDPSLGVSWIENLSQLHINVMGVIQLEVLKFTVKERFGIDVEFEQPEVLYMETITEETTGFGHFEPYRHYSEVKFKMTPTPRNSGISYSSNINHDILHPRWQRAVAKLVYPACQRGVLTGSPITDIHFELIKGSAHVQYTAGGDFKQSTFRAVRQGVENAKNILLEPYYIIKITVEQDLCGKIMTDINKMYGTFEPPVTISSNCIITGRVPVASSMNYATELASFTKGKASINFQFDGYDICHNTDEIIQKYNYDKDSDAEFTSNSVYCNKGSVYSIPGSEAESYRRY